MTIRTRRHWLAATILAFTGTASAQAAELPPLVVTPPKPPVKTVTAKPDTPKIEAAKPAAKVEPVVVTPKIEVPPPVISVPAKTASLIKPVLKPAMAEIVAAGPAPVDATASLQAALKEAREAVNQVRDLSGHVILQERHRGEAGDEFTAEIRWKTKPKSMALKFTAPSSVIGREIVFADGRHGNKARVKAAGTYGPLAFANLALSDPKAMVTAKCGVLDITPAAVLERVERALAMEAKLRNPVAVQGADYTFAGKTVTRFEIRCDYGHALRDAPLLVVCLDPETKLPVRFEAHDTSLREAISFVNVAVNKGISESSFEK